MIYYKDENVSTFLCYTPKCVLRKYTKERTNEKSFKLCGKRADGERNIFIKLFATYIQLDVV